MSNKTPNEISRILDVSQMFNDQLRCGDTTNDGPHMAKLRKLLAGIGEGVGVYYTPDANKPGRLFHVAAGPDATVETLAEECHRVFTAPASEFVDVTDEKL